MVVRLDERDALLVQRQWWTIYAFAIQGKPRLNFEKKHAEIELVSKIELKLVRLYLKVEDSLPTSPQLRYRPAARP